MVDGRSGWLERVENLKRSNLNACIDLHSPRHSCKITLITPTLVILVGLSLDSSVSIRHGSPLAEDIRSINDDTFAAGFPKRCFVLETTLGREKRSCDNQYDGYMIRAGTLLKNPGRR